MGFGKVAVCSLNVFDEDAFDDREGVITLSELVLQDQTDALFHLFVAFDLLFLHFLPLLCPFCHSLVHGCDVNECASGSLQRDLL